VVAEAVGKFLTVALVQAEVVVAVFKLDNSLLLAEHLTQLLLVVVVRMVLKPVDILVVQLH
jgi:hypothetical protein